MTYHLSEEEFCKLWLSFKKETPGVKALLQVEAILIEVFGITDQDILTNALTSSDTIAAKIMFQKTHQPNSNSNCEKQIPKI
jgi:hypothetical protein